MTWTNPKEEMPDYCSVDDDNAVWIWCKDGVCLGEALTPDYWWATEWDAGIPGDEVYGWQPLNRPKVPKVIHDPG